jgi:hypothetical protein
MRFQRCSNIALTDAKQTKPIIIRTFDQIEYQIERETAPQGFRKRAFKGPRTLEN